MKVMKLYFIKIFYFFLITYLFYSYIEKLLHKEFQKLNLILNKNHSAICFKIISGFTCKFIYEIWLSLCNHSFEYVYIVYWTPWNKNKPRSEDILEPFFVPADLRSSESLKQWSHILKRPQKCFIYPSL